MSDGHSRVSRRVVSVLLLVLVGCSSPLPSSITTPAVTETPAVPAQSPMSSPTAVASATEPNPAPADPTLITQICEDWNAKLPEGSIECDSGLRAALDFVGQSKGGVQRLYLFFTPRCRSGVDCPARRPDQAWVAIRSTTGEVVVAVSVRVDGTTLATGPATDVVPPPAPAFSPPVIGRPTIDDPVPAEVARREPFPLCGVEASGLGDPFDRIARRCFVDGVLAGQPVEFVTKGRGTEGESFVTLHRFAGRGAIVTYYRDAGAWTRIACGIEVEESDRVFGLDGLCRRTDLTAGG
jgi:hypothetical protein